MKKSTTLLTLLHTADTRGRLFLITYDYTESGKSERFGFLCRAKDIVEAAELFLNQHPGEWFHLISVHDGETELFWLRDLGRFVTVPGKE